MNEQNINPSIPISSEKQSLNNQGEIFRPLEINSLFKRAWQIYKSQFWTFIGIMALPIALNILALILMVFAGVGGLLFWEAGGFIVAFLLAFIIWFIIVMVNIWGTVALLCAIKEREKKIGVIEAFKQGKGLLFSYIWVSLLVSLCVLGGTILLIIPGFIFAVWFQCAIFVLAAEGVKGSGALSRSKELVKGYWWKVFLRSILVGLVAFVVSLIIGLIPFIGGLLASILLTPFVTLFLFIIYEDLKQLKEKVIPHIERSATL